MQALTAQQVKRTDNPPFQPYKMLALKKMITHICKKLYHNDMNYIAWLPHENLPEVAGAVAVDKLLRAGQLQVHVSVSGNQESLERSNQMTKLTHMTYHFLRNFVMQMEKDYELKPALN